MNKLEINAGRYQKCKGQYQIPPIYGYKFIIKTSCIKG